MKKLLSSSFLIIICLVNCNNTDDITPSTSEILGFDVLRDLNGHWVGTNETSFGFYDWFAFDFRPISASHLHSIYEGGTNQNIITSLFVADFEGRQQIMAGNGGWLGNQYRATYFVLDKAEITSQYSYYRLVDAVGREHRAYMELRFEQDSLFFDAYKDNSGSLDEPVHHMGFKGSRYNTSYSSNASSLFEFPKALSEVNFGDSFSNLVDPDSALFLEESQDPFPKQQHGHISDLQIEISKSESIAEDQLLLYISKSSLNDNNGTVDFDNLDQTVVRTIDIQGFETSYLSTYLHPDTYFITFFSDKDGNFFPSAGDYYNISQEITVEPESLITMEVNINSKL